MNNIRRLFKDNKNDKYHKPLLNDDEREYYIIQLENELKRLQLELKEKEETIQMIETINKELMKELMKK